MKKKKKKKKNFLEKRQCFYWRVFEGRRREKQVERK